MSGHGGHSGEFCCHARDSLEAIVERYAELGFDWVGLTEHMPAVSDELVASDEREAGFDAKALYARFEAYIARARELQHKLRPHLRVLVAFETEACTGSEASVRGLIERFEPDYIVGSVHHVRDLLIDATPELFAEAAARAGGVEALYEEYFDAQHALICAFAPAIVGHFDLVRLLDPDADAHLAQPAVRARITRNLRAMRERDCALDLNARALAKGLPEPYPCAPILAEARALGLRAIPGDDSHGVAGVGADLDRAQAALEEQGFPPPTPPRVTPKSLV